jgi:hypothetical protein
MEMPEISQDYRASFAGSVRGVDEVGHFAFEVHLPSSTPFYGEYRPKRAPNGNDFDIEIVSFGFVYRDNLGNAMPTARRQFTEQQRRIVECLVKGLFADPEARKGKPIFCSQKARFLGGVYFLPRWIRIEQ